MTYNDLAELFKREGGDAQVCFSVISQNQILFGNNNTKKDIISFTNEEPIKWVKEVQEEPASEELEDFALQYAGHHAPYDSCMQEVVDAVKAGAKWQKHKIEE